MAVQTKPLTKVKYVIAGDSFSESGYHLFNLLYSFQML